MYGLFNKTLFAVVLGFCVTAQAGSCPTAAPSSSDHFCETFRAAAECHCVSKGLPSGMCNNINLLYKRMIDTLGTLQRACDFQHDTSAQECIDDWNCYRYGGFTSDGKLCNVTGHACS